MRKKGCPRSAGRKGDVPHARQAAWEARAGIAQTALVTLGWVTSGCVREGVGTAGSATSRSWVYIWCANPG